MTRTGMNRRSFLAVAGAGAGAALAWPGQGRADPLSPDAVFHDPDALVLGNPDGDVTIVEFFDFQCPFCKRNYPVVEQVLAADPKLRLVMKDWPIFGPPSLLASQLVYGASSLGEYQPALNALMATSGHLSDAEVMLTLRNAGIDVAKAAAAYNQQQEKWTGLLQRNAAQAEGLGLQGTPAFIVGYSVYLGAMTAGQLRKAVAEARAA